MKEPEIQTSKHLIMTSHTLRPYFYTVYSFITREPTSSSSKYFFFSVIVYESESSPALPNAEQKKKKKRGWGQCLFLCL